MARILVVDDSRMVHGVVQQALAPLGHVVDCLRAFTELPNYMRMSPPDLVLLDLEMPALSGVAFAKFIRNVESSPTPILIHSSLPLVEQEEAARRVDAIGIIPKGTVGHALRELVVQALSHRPEAHEHA